MRKNLNSLLDALLMRRSLLVLLLVSLFSFVSCSTLIPKPWPFLFLSTLNAPPHPLALPDNFEVSGLAGVLSSAAFTLYAVDDLGQLAIMRNFARNESLAAPLDAELSFMDVHLFVIPLREFSTSAGDWEGVVVHPLFPDGRRVFVVAERLLALFEVDVVDRQVSAQHGLSASLPLTPEQNNKKRRSG